jgi:hypothetical protein
MPAVCESTFSSDAFAKLLQIIGYFPSYAHIP